MYFIGSMQGFFSFEVQITDSVPAIYDRANVTVSFFGANTMNVDHWIRNQHYTLSPSNVTLRLDSARLVVSRASKWVLW